MTSLDTVSSALRNLGGSPGLSSWPRNAVIVLPITTQHSAWNIIGTQLILMKQNLRNIYHKYIYITFIYDRNYISYNFRIWDWNRTWESVFLTSSPGDSADQVSQVHTESVLSWAYLPQGCESTPSAGAFQSVPTAMTSPLNTYVQLVAMHLSLGV